MRILIVGSGGREHALAWKLTREGHDVLAAPGNPGTERIGLPSVPTDTAADLVVVGPEVPLVAGFADDCRERGRLVVGPSKVNAQIEGSKIYSKELMQRLGIPTARFSKVATVEA